MTQERQTVPVIEQLKSLVAARELPIIKDTFTPEEQEEYLGLLQEGHGRPFDPQSMFNALKPGEYEENMKYSAYRERIDKALYSSEIVGAPESDDHSDIEIIIDGKTFKLSKLEKTGITATVTGELLELSLDYKSNPPQPKIYILKLISGSEEQWVVARQYIWDRSQRDLPRSIGYTFAFIQPPTGDKIISPQASEFTQARYSFSTLFGFDVLPNQDVLNLETGELETQSRDVVVPVEEKLAKMKGWQAVEMYGLIAKASASSGSESPVTFPVNKNKTTLTLSNKRN